MSIETETALQQAADAIRDAEALIIGAGAGMGVDSGLPDFRGDQGFWKAYPPFARVGLSFVEVAQPVWFARDPELAWGFYGHRLNLYRSTPPHAGFQILRRWAESRPGGAFVFTSNVDGQFQKAGFAATQVVECHGSIHHLQCARPCCDTIWSADETDVHIDETTFRAFPPLPACPRCQGVARPNILMFHDGQWLSERTEAQEEAFAAWLSGLRGTRVAIVECGAGTAISAVRQQMEHLAWRHNAPLIRINPREAYGPDVIALPLPALEALQAIAQRTGTA